MQNQLQRWGGNTLSARVDKPTRNWPHFASLTCMTMLPRLHLFELEDQSWFPTTIRDLATDYIRFLVRAREPIGIFEIPDRRWSTLLSLLLLTPGA